MGFQITLVPPTPSEAVLCAETPVHGLEFVAIAEQCLRRVIGGSETQTHNILGRLTNYPIQLTDKMAIESGLFEKTNNVYIIVPNNALKKYIFYTADRKTVTAGTTVSRIYPNYATGAIITSRIDEFAFLEDWQKFSYPTSMVGLIDAIEPDQPTSNGNTAVDTTPPTSTTGCMCGPFCNMGH